MTDGFWPVIRAGFDGLPYRPAGYFYSVDGTVYAGAPAPPQPLIDGGGGWWAGFASGMVGGMINVADGLWASRCIGYPAQTIPMWPSVQVGRANLIAAIRSDADAYLSANGSYDGLVIAGSGYSQGSMVWDQVYLLDIMDEAGVLHELLPYVYRIYQFGHVFRCPGIAHGNTVAGLSQSIITDGVQTGGIGVVMDLTEAQTNYASPTGDPVVYSCANQGDIYTCCPTGLDPWTDPAPQAATGELFFRIVMQPTFTDVVEAAEALETPVPTIEEGINAGTFFAEGMNAPHYEYYPQMDACIGDVIALGNSLPHEFGATGG